MNAGQKILPRGLWIIKVDTLTGRGYNLIIKFFDKKDIMIKGDRKK